MEIPAGGLIAILSALIAIAANEYYRKRARIESYSERLFDKRLSVHEELSAHIGLLVIEAREIFDQNLTDKERTNHAHQFRRSFKDDKELIRQASGVS